MGRYFASILITLLVTFVSQLALAYPTPVDFDGKLLRWNITIDSAPILYEVKADDDNDLYLYGAMVDDSSDMWTDVSTSYFALQKAAASETAQVTVHLQKNIEMAASSGYTTFDEFDDNGPLHCSVYIATGLGLSFTAVAKTILHEIGHCIGLGHSLIPQAVMSYYFEDNSYALDIDDKAAVSRLYPADGSKPKLPPGCSVAANADGHQTLMSLLLFLLPFTLGVGFRFRASCR